MRGIKKPRVVLVLAAVVGVLGVLAAWRSGEANPIPSALGVSAVGYGGFGGGGAEEPSAEPNAVYLSAPMTEKSARVWIELRKPVSMPFANETPLEDAIKYVRSATVSNDFPNGIPVYVNPVGLREADKTMQSTVQINLEEVPLALSLKLALEQLDLGFEVRPEGLLYITYIQSVDAKDPMPMLLNEVQEARREVCQLRRDVAELKAILMSRGEPAAKK